MKTQYLFLILFISLLSCKKNSPAPGEKIPDSDTLIQNISYGSNAANVLDLYLPANRDANTKVVIMIHGGGWNAGDKKELAFLAQGLKDRGFAVANINYRLSPQSDDNYKMQLDDISAVENWLVNKAGMYSYSSKNIYITGHSAGAHLSLSFAYTRNTNNKIKAAGGMATPTDLVAGATANFGIVGANTITPYLGGPLNAATLAKYENASPLYHVSNSTVPTILFQGNVDFIVPLAQATALDNKLKENGVPEKLIVYNGVFHDWWGDANLVKNTLDETAAWFNKY
ncbi:MAG: alpha/beta hydrolase [Ginsengibacter sp.]